MCVTDMMTLSFITVHVKMATKSCHISIDRSIDPQHKRNLG